MNLLLFWGSLNYKATFFLDQNYMLLKKEIQKCHKVQTRKDTYSELKLSTSTWMVFFRITNVKVFFHIIFIFKLLFFPYYIYFQVPCKALIITAVLSIPALEINEAFISLDPLRILCYLILR